MLMLADKDDDHDDWPHSAGERRQAKEARDERKPLVIGRY